MCQRLEVVTTPNCGLDNELLYVFPRHLYLECNEYETQVFLDFQREREREREREPHQWWQEAALRAMTQRPSIDGGCTGIGGGGGEDKGECNKGLL